MQFLAYKNYIPTCLGNSTTNPKTTWHQCKSIDAIFVLFGPSNTHTSIIIYNHILHVKIEIARYTTSFAISLKVMKLARQTKILKMSSKI